MISLAITLKIHAASSWLLLAPIVPFSKELSDMAARFRIALVAFMAMKGVSAWGALGHATVAYVAQHYISSSTASW